MHIKENLADASLHVKEFLQLYIFSEYSCLLKFPHVFITGGYLLNAAMCVVPFKVEKI